MINNDRELNRYSIALRDFEKTIEFLKEAEKHLNNPLVYESLLTCAVLYYYRPFSSNERNVSAKATSRISIESFSHLNKDDLVLHKRCEALRNKTVAHAEWSSYPTQRCSETGVIVSRVYSILSESIDWNALHSLAEKLMYQCHHLRADYLNKVRKGQNRKK